MPDLPVIDDIFLPVPFERFIPPDLEKVMEDYPKYLWHGGKLQIQPYLLTVVHQFAQYEQSHGTAENREGLDAIQDKVIGMFLRHVGIPRFSELIKRGELAYEFATSLDSDVATWLGMKRRS
jgi:hypothetical protein